MKNICETSDANSEIGKTILSSTVIEDLRQGISQPDEIVIYFYFDFNDSSKQLVDKMLQSLIVQISSMRPQVPKSLAALYDSCGQGSKQPQTSGMMDVLRELVGLYGKVSIVLDALDECESRQELLDFIKELVLLKSERLNLIATGRNIKDLDDSIRHEFGPGKSFAIPEESVNDDIRSYGKGVLRSDRRFQRWHRHPDVLDEIEDRLTDQAGGMFRWVACQLDAMSGCLSLSKLRQKLDSLPTTLDGTYERILCKIDPAYKRETLQILQWLACSMRPLTITEVAELVAFDGDSKPKFDAAKRLADIEEILSLCSSLTLCTMPDGSDSDQIDQDSGSGGSNQDSKGTTFTTIRLAHFTVKEYLMSDRIRHGPAAFFSLGEEMSHLRIAETCLSCLLLYEMILFVDEGEFTIEFPIAKYSARYWVSHFRKARSILEKRHFEHASELFLDEHKLQNWVALYDIDDAMEICGRYKQGSSLYYAVLTGLYGLVEVVLQSGNYIYANEETSIGRRSVFEAHDHGKAPPCHTNKRTPIDSRGGYLHTPLHAASYYRLFIGLETRSALSASAKNGDTATANVLLGNGADIHEGVPCPPFASTGVSDLGKSNNKTQFVPKNVMLESCPPKYFRLIVDEMGRSFDEADFQTLKGPFHTALFHAAYNGHTEMVNVLLDRGARIDLRNGDDGMTALMEASEQGGDKMVELLLERGAQVDKTDIWGSTAFIRACDAGKESIARLLLERGALIDKTNLWGETALIRACDAGKESIARLLLERGALIDKADIMGDTALTGACDAGKESIARLLLERGALIDKPDIWGNTALAWAYVNGNESIARLLLEKSAHGSSLTRVVKQYPASSVLAKQLILEKEEERNQRDSGGP
ncbi:MAG: hypothetical protein Q9211_004980 [Gyalolechia sp. 1 TL-2023]